MRRRQSVKRLNGQSRKALRPPRSGAAIRLPHEASYEVRFRADRRAGCHRVPCPSTARTLSQDPRPRRQSAHRFPRTMPLLREEGAMSWRGQTRLTRGLTRDPEGSPDQGAPLRIVNSANAASREASLDGTRFLEWQGEPRCRIASRSAAARDPRMHGLGGLGVAEPRHLPTLRKGSSRLNECLLYSSLNNGRFPRPRKSEEFNQRQGWLDAT